MWDRNHNFGPEAKLLLHIQYHRENTLLSVEDRLNVVRRQLEEVDKVQDQVFKLSARDLCSIWNYDDQVKTLRKKIADAYAERLADNMTSCVTQ